MPNEIQIPENSVGAITTPKYHERTPKVFPVYDSEMRTISTLNTIATLSFTTAGSLISFGGGLLVTSFMGQATTIRAQIFVSLIVPIAFLLATIAIIIGVVALKKRGGTIDEIKSESRELDMPTP